MPDIALTCRQCSAPVLATPSHVNRSTKIGAPLYCGRACAGLARRLANPPTPEQKKAAKVAYDIAYRKRNAAKRKAEKAAYYQRTRDPEKERESRKARMPKHVEYCRTPEYRAKKAAYDKRKRFEEFGPFAEAAMLLEELESEINARATRYEIYITNGRFARNAQQRRRELWQQLRSGR